MNSLPLSLPDLILLADCDQKWDTYVENIYRRFASDFIDSQPKYLNCWVRHRRDPHYDQKPAGFWHCVSTGKVENDRLPDLRRCERIGWIRPIIENHTHEDIDTWTNKRDSDVRHLLWYREQFLVILAEREKIREGKDPFRYFQFITSYCTEQEHTKDKLRKERDEFRGL